MQEGVNIINSKEDISKFMRMPFVMKYNVVAWFSFFLFSFIVFFYVLFIFNNNSEIENRIVIFSVFFSIFIFVFVFYKRNSSFILSADYKGIYYKNYSEGNEFVFLDWAHIQSMDVLYDGGRELRILTNLSSIPSPCNGQIYNHYGFQELSFSLGFIKTSKAILIELNELKNSKKLK